MRALAPRLRRTVLRAAVLLAAAPVVAGCGNVNAGEQAVSDFEDWWDGHAVDGVEIIHTQDNNDLPYAGSGEIWLMPEASVDVAGLVDELCGYDPDKETVFHLDSAKAPESIAAAQASQERDVEVEVDCSERDRTVSRWASLLATDGLRNASLSSGNLVANFESADSLVTAVPQLRDLDPEQLHLSAGEFNAPGALRFDDEGVSAEIRDLLDAVLASGVPVLAVDASEHHRGDAHLEVVVAGDHSDADRLEQVLLETNPTPPRWSRSLPPPDAPECETAPDHGQWVTAIRCRPGIDG
ncbi:hypothetical protein [Nocardioides jensenii]|uniref:hypothetical protein n=1 Tax=Nocardioides jensenii TaxID=1843 RepID=UPI00082D6964|nr:hypothetical protein [Nocardioides jensenii]